MFQNLQSRSADLVCSAVVSFHGSDANANCVFILPEFDSIACVNGSHHSLLSMHICPGNCNSFDLPDDERLSLLAYDTLQ